jgi:hypothetical protein
LDAHRPPGSVAGGGGFAPRARSDRARRAAERRRQSRPGRHEVFFSLIHRSQVGGPRPRVGSLLPARAMASRARVLRLPAARIRAPREPSAIASRSRFSGSRSGTMSMVTPTSPWRRPAPRSRSVRPPTGLSPPAARAQPG